MRARRLPLALLLPAVVLALALPPGRGALAQGAYPEEAVEAVFLYRFAGYVQWPAAAARPPFTIAVLGDDEVAAQLQALLPGHPIHGEPSRVRIITGVRQLGSAQMLYVGAGYRGDLHALLAPLAGRPVLVVTDQQGALDEGSTVNFLLDHQHVRFEISLQNARRSGLAISSALLAVAERVRTGDGRPEPCLAVGHRSRRCLPRLAGL
jgi:YfiR/HmsC-like